MRAAQVSAFRPSGLVGLMTCLLFVLSVVAVHARAEGPGVDKTSGSAEAGGEKVNHDDKLAGALDKDKQRSYLDTATELRCPTCTGLSVLESDAPFSVQIKNLVKEQVAQGKSKDEILKYFTERYGPWILRSPPKEGFNLVAWGAPIALLIAGPLLVWFFVWRRQQVVVGRQGVRPTEVIVEELEQRLAVLRQKHQGRQAGEQL